MPPITQGVKYLLIANIVIFCAALIGNKIGIHIDGSLALYYIKSPKFSPYQFVTYMFVHAGFMHIFFNMFALYQFGTMIESQWGTKRFTFYYLVTGVGAGLINTLVNYYQLQPLTEAANMYFAQPQPETLAALADKSNLINSVKLLEIVEAWSNGEYSDQTVIDQTFNDIQKIISYSIDRPIVGASGAVFGLLLAFGMMYPDLKLYIMFIPIGIKAKYFVILYGIAELFFGVNDFSSDNIAHFAHLGGMFVGWILLSYWKKHPHNEWFN